MVAAKKPIEIKKVDNPRNQAVSFFGVQKVYKEKRNVKESELIA